MRDCSQCSTTQIWVTTRHLHGTVKARYNEVPRDWHNLLAITRFFSIYFTITGLHMQIYLAKLANLWSCKRLGRSWRTVLCRVQVLGSQRFISVAATRLSRRLCQNLSSDYSQNAFLHKPMRSQAQPKWLIRSEWIVLQIDLDY